MQSRASHATTAYEKIFCRKDMLKLLIGRAKAMVHLWVCLYPMQLVAIRCLVGEGGEEGNWGNILASSHRIQLCDLYARDTRQVAGKIPKAYAFQVDIELQGPQPIGLKEFPEFRSNE